MVNFRALYNIAREEFCESFPYEEALPPRYNFNNVEDFALCHRRGTEAEFLFESQQIRKFNENEYDFKAWPIMAIEPGNPTTTWLLMVAPGPEDSLLPKEGESCRVKVYYKDSDESFAKSSASRVDNPCASWGVKDDFWQRCMAFEIDLWCNNSSTPTKLKKGEERPSVTLTPAITAKSFKQDGSVQVPKRHNEPLRVRFELRLSSSTKNAEIGALDRLLELREANSPEAEKQVAAFEYFVTLDSTEQSSLFDVFPHMADPIRDPKKVHKILMERFSKFNRQQTYAYMSLLNNIPNGICMVPGGPGAGKTFWNLSVAALMQAKDEIKKPEEANPSESRNRVLYLLDMNRPLTDVASKMVQVYRELGLTKKCCNDCPTPQPRNVIRMFCWSYESRAPTQGFISAERNEFDRRRERVRRGQKPEDGEGPLTKYDKDKDKTEKVALQGFSEPFLKIRKQSTSPQQHRPAEQDCSVMTLDEAANEYFERHRRSKYAVLNEFLDNFKHVSDLEALLDFKIERLYKDTLENADFIATTPVTASKFSHALFNPTLIMFDEAPHARDLTLLISVALFTPQAWILTGDHRQTKPFVLSLGKHRNRYVEQLRVSVMERAFKKNPDMPALLINHRTSGNLQELASKLFYNSKMKPAEDPSVAGAIPSEALHLREKYLMPMKNHKGPQVSRLLVVLKGCGPPQKVQSSWHNEDHQDWVKKLICTLTRDDGFRQINSKERGTILIMSPYKRAVIEYGRVLRDLRKERQTGFEAYTVEARTVDTAQGHEADVCILDFVNSRCTPHLEDANRMCVALTRARQAEFIIMHEKMVEHVESYPFRYPLMVEMIDYCKDNGQYVYGPKDIWKH
ncbi:hypothetical protein N0V93_008640 [Gnomoniopsis smithogilvyi]|uniref:Uncharacterized protein n=1 Tax=Gnomoniopsis smithogilvyi TaxID=1191159 RepID=A0A9W9CTW2_9PEZI|nr:hypothetical protein N0V93_008640 [Gnomoniopsis smithogilvyi]